ncbi:hypothetical protein [Paenibacillus sp. JDR-2]|uniref:hypothetical protein n=1 Tax=Paenibacillus sp. (strain JDR-2) TaxID=324057 RepID=UPI000166AF92|nr:hypothetical protein [Paenibacillus sp. JDR-2]ACS98972.1 conserved hypothetical protein [Paenibacillus sp. JDR-2]
MKTYRSVKIKDWSTEYKGFVSANKNKKKSVNRWYPILEGFSNSFVESVINEQCKTNNLICLDPFAGGGTTPLVAQELGVKCYSFEVSPFMSQVCRAKLRNDYKSAEFVGVVELLKSKLLEDGFTNDYRIELKTISKKKTLDKWLFHKTALTSLLNIRKAIEISTADFPVYYDILNVALGSILLQFSNVYRDGKAVKYKANWRTKYYKTKQIYNAYIEKCLGSVLLDIQQIEASSSINKQINNQNYFINGDCRDLVGELNDNELDLVITSPPYLNSRDYTDSHMIELWLLGHVHNYSDVRALRQKTMRSHVQVTWGEIPKPTSKILEECLFEIMKFQKKFWNRNIPSMIVGYFKDIEELLSALRVKMKTKGKLYINVANSSYYGVIIETDRIIEEIATNLGYSVLEIRLARKIKTSSQQYEEVKWLRESVIILENSK